MRDEDLPIHDTAGCPFCSCPRKECSEDDVIEKDGKRYGVCSCTWHNHRWLCPSFELPLAVEEDGTVTKEALDDALSRITDLLGGR
jgi:hypothetical protein